MNFTGSLIGCEGFATREGTNYDSELVSIDCPTTVIITSEVAANAIYERCGEIFAARQTNDDRNPAIDLLVETNSIRPTNTNILVTDVTKAYVSKETSLLPSNDSIIESLAALKQFSAAKTTVISKANTNKLPAANTQFNAARAGLKSVVQTAKSVIEHL